MLSYPPYHGSRLKLILAFEVGATNSAISYCILNPGQIPEIKWVSRFPACEEVKGLSRIPTIIYYDRSGNVRAVGAETRREGVCEAAENGGWAKAKCFKSHLSKGSPAQDITQLPPGKTVVDVFSDFYAYLLTCASNYIGGTHANGPHVWITLENDIEFVITHPNGWDGVQISTLKQAAVLAKLIPDTSAGHGRLWFVAEGEANLHTALHDLPVASIEKGDGVVVVEAGNDTIKFACYGKITGQRDDKGGYEELAPPQTHFKGFAFVSGNARLFLSSFLKGSLFFGDLDHIVQCFDATTKIRFRNPDEPQYIRFGSTRDNDASCNIRFGQLKLDGADVAFFFEPSITCIVNAVEGVKRNAQKPISHVVLIGEFAANDWLFASVQKKLSPLGLNVVRPKTHISTIIPDGAISYYLTQVMQGHRKLDTKAMDTQPKAKVPEPKPATPASPTSMLDGSNSQPARGMALSEMLRRL